MRYLKTVPKRAFLDANVWFSAAHSQKGGSFLIMKLAMAGFITVFANRYVLAEAERNLLLKSPDALKTYYELIAQITPTITDLHLTYEMRNTLDKFIPLTDLPVVAGALNCGADYLISLDKRDIVNNKIKKLEFPFQIVTPAEFLEVFRRGLRV